MKLDEKETFICFMGDLIGPSHLSVGLLKGWRVSVELVVRDDHPSQRQRLNTHGERFPC